MVRRQNIRPTRVLTALALGLLLSVGACSTRAASAQASRANLRLAHQTPEVVSMEAGAWREFRASVTDTLGSPVIGARIVWQTPEAGPLTYVCATGPDGACGATNLYTFASGTHT